VIRFTAVLFVVAFTYGCAMTKSTCLNYHAALTAASPQVCRDTFKDDEAGYQDCIGKATGYGPAIALLCETRPDDAKEPDG
jgi:hypothetical protein